MKQDWYAMHCIAERSRSFLRSRLAERQKVEAQRAEEIYERLLIAFPAQKKCSVCTNAKGGRGIVRITRAARADRVKDTVVLRASQGRSVAPGSLAILLSDDRGGRRSGVSFAYDYRQIKPLPVILSGVPQGETRLVRDALYRGTQSKLFAVEQSERQKVEAQRAEEIYERLLIAFPAQRNIPSA